MYSYKNILVPFEQGPDTPTKSALQRCMDAAAEHARSGWRLVQIVAPTGTRADIAAPQAYTLILEQQATAACMETETRRPREQAIRLWFRMWTNRVDLGMGDIFTPDCIYIESWGPQYTGLPAIRHWFREWNSRGRVLVWEAARFFHTHDQTAVEWAFEYAMDGEQAKCYDGMSLVSWDDSGKITAVKEFGCRRGHFDPYEQNSALGWEEADMWA